MLWAAASILMIIWLLGLVTGYTLSSFIHILLVLAIIIVLIRIDDSEEEAHISQSQIDK
jgi:protein-S-isoprenylcysteine O-methyltransferase Ste14